ncbi:hypothetical protein FHT93_004094 [Rhizobium sp. BK379]|nr:hypothetical protein [Rhizobium sp. BK379]
MVLLTMASIGAAIDGLTKTLDILSKWRAAFPNQETKRKRIFTAYIEPMFVALQPVFRTYADGIAELRAGFALAKNGTEAKARFHEFLEYRRKLAQARSELYPQVQSAVEYLRNTQDYRMPVFKDHCLRSSKRWTRISLARCSSLRKRGTSISYRPWRIINRAAPPRPSLLLSSISCVEPIG